MSYKSRTPLRHRLARRMRQIVIGLAALAGSSCAGVSLAPWSVDHQGHLGPGTQSYKVPAPGSPEIDLGTSSIPDGSPQPEPVEVPIAPIPTIKPQDGPRIVPRGVTVPGKVDLTVHAPKKKQVGSGALFRLVVTNLGDEPIAEVAVATEFDKGLQFPGKVDKHAEQSLGTLAARETKEVSLTLVGDIPGRQCARFSVTSRGSEQVWKSVCVEFVPRTLEVRIVGPKRRTLGSQAEFNIKVSNTGSKPLNKITTILGFDSPLKVAEASSGWAKHSDGLSWDLGTLKPGEGVQIQVEFDCVAEAERTCLTVTVTGEEIPDEDQQQCLVIEAVRGVIELQVADTDDPIRDGDEFDYVVTVRNRGLQAAQGIVVRAQVPDGMRVVSTEVTEGETQLTLGVKIDGSDLTFDLRDNLGQDKELTYRIRVKTTRTGDGEFRAEVVHAGSRTPIESREPTTVNAR
jgi:uncharacterized repeat protein (TIGR01451 family)